MWLKFWLRVLNELKARGVSDVLIAVCDGLTGLPEAINAVWPQTKVQTCIVHLIPASLRWVNYTDRKKVAALLRPIYKAPTEAAARAELDALADSDFGRNNPGVIRRWRDSWGLVIPFFDFTPEVRTVHLHHEHDRVDQQPAAPRHPQPRPLPLRRG